MSLEQRAILKLAEDNAEQALANLRKQFPQLARQQLKAAVENIDLAEMLGLTTEPEPQPQPKQLPDAIDI